MYVDLTCIDIFCILFYCILLFILYYGYFYFSIYLYICMSYIYSIFFYILLQYYFSIIFFSKTKIYINVCTIYKQREEGKDKTVMMLRWFKTVLIVPRLQQYLFFGSKAKGYDPFVFNVPENNKKRKSLCFVAAAILPEWCLGLVYCRSRWHHATVPKSYRFMGSGGSTSGF